jgi:hypothetical protein
MSSKLSKLKMCGVSTEGFLFLRRMETWRCIFPYLGPEDRRSCSRVSKGLKKVADAYECVSHPHIFANAQLPGWLRLVRVPICWESVTIRPYDIPAEHGDHHLFDLSISHSQRQGSDHNISWMTLLPRLAWIQSMDLSWAGLCDDGLSKLVDALAKGTVPLRHLILVGNDLTLSDTTAYFQPVCFRELLTLNLRGNEIGRDSLRNIGERFAFLPSLTSLDLSENDLDNAGALVLVEGLGLLQELREFRLDDVILWDDAIDLFAHWVVSMKHLQSLHLTCSLGRMTQAVFCFEPFFRAPRDFVLLSIEPSEAASYLESWDALRGFFSYRRTEQINCLNLTVCGWQRAGKTKLIDALIRATERTHLSDAAPTLSDSESTTDHHRAIRFLEIEEQLWRMCELGHISGAAEFARFSLLSQHCYSIFLIVVSFCDVDGVTALDQVDYWLELIASVTRLPDPLLQTDVEGVHALPLSKVTIAVTNLDSKSVFDLDNGGEDDHQPLYFEQQKKLLEAHILNNSYHVPIAEILWINYDSSIQPLSELMLFLQNSWDSMLRNAWISPETFSLLSKVITVDLNPRSTVLFSIASLRKELNITSIDSCNKLIEALEYLNSHGFIVYSRDIDLVCLSPLWLYWTPLEQLCAPNPELTPLIIQLVLQYHVCYKNGPNIIYPQLLPVAEWVELDFADTSTWAGVLFSLPVLTWHNFMGDICLRWQENCDISRVKDGLVLNGRKAALGQFGQLVVQYSLAEHDSRVEVSLLYRDSDRASRVSTLHSLLRSAAGRIAGTSASTDPCFSLNCPGECTAVVDMPFAMLSICPCEENHRIGWQDIEQHALHTTWTFPCGRTAPMIEVRKRLLALRNGL